MKLVILESPYAGDIDGNVTYARRCVRDSLMRGEAPIASHLLFTQPGILRDEIPDERALGINAGLAWRWMADYSAFYTDLGWSSGMLGALHRALAERRLFRVRAIDGLASFPSSLDEETDRFIRNSVDGEVR